MLQAPLPYSTTAKLDISLLLKSSPSPPPTLPAVAPPRGIGSGSSSGGGTRSIEGPGGSRGEGAADYPSRSSSLPPASHAYFPAPGPQSHRTSPDSNVSPGTTPRASVGMSPQPSHSQRPFLPPLSTTTTLPPPHPSPHQQHEQYPSPHQQPLQYPSPRQYSPRHSLPPGSSHPLSSHAQPGHRQSWAPSGYVPPSLPSPLHPPQKRPPPTSPHPQASPAKRQSKWTPDEDALIIDLRGSGMKWEDISKRLPGRSAISCRLHYQNYLERRSEWDEERKNRLARLYERLKPEMWAPLAAELSIPWRAAEAMHWQLGEADMARRAGVVPFSLATPGVGPGPTSAPTSIERSAMIPPSLAPGPGPYSMPGTPSTGGPHGTPGGYGMGPYHEVGRGGTSRREASLVGPAGGGLPPALSGAPGTGHGVLPSLAELERGMTAYDNGGGSGPTSGRYSSGGR